MKDPQIPQMSHQHPVELKPVDFGAQEDGSPIARAKAAIAELYSNRKRAVERIAKRQAELDQEKESLDEIDGALRDLGQVPVPRGPRVKKVAP